MHVVHGYESHQNPDRDRQYGYYRAPEMEEEYDYDQAHDDHFFDECPFKRLYCAEYEVGTVIRGHDLHSFGQRRFYVIDLLFHTFYHVESIFTVAHDDDSADRLSFPVELGNASPYIGTELHIGDVPYIDGGPVPVRRDRYILNILY